MQALRAVALEEGKAIADGGKLDVEGDMGGEVGDRKYSQLQSFLIFDGLLDEAHLLTSHLAGATFPCLPADEI